MCVPFPAHLCRPHFRLSLLIKQTAAPVLNQQVISPSSDANAGNVKEKGWGLSIITVPEYLNPQLNNQWNSNQWLKIKNKKTIQIINYLSEMTHKGVQYYRQANVTHLTFPPFFNGGRPDPLITAVPGWRHSQIGALRTAYSRWANLTMLGCRLCWRVRWLGQNWVSLFCR